MTHDELLSSLSLNEDRLSSYKARIVPASFSLNDPSLKGFPIPAQWRWPSLARLLTEEGVAGVMLRAALLWQLEVPLRHACDEGSAFVFINDPGNMPLGAAALRQANIDLVITDEEDAEAFSRYTLDHGAPLPRLLVISPLRPPRAFSAHIRTRVFRELHLFPGVPVFTQCSALAGEEARFHAEEGFRISRNGGVACIDGPEGFPVPLRSYESGLRMSEDGACACGKALWRLE